MKETTNHKIRYPEPKDPDTLAAYWENQANDVERELDKIDPKQIIGGSAGKLIIAKSTGAGAFTAMKGDATLAEDGTLTIANDAITAAKIAESAVGASEIAANAVGASEIAAGAVEESELADKAVTSRKAKLTAGLLRATSELKCTTSFQDVPGVSLEITPAVESLLKVTIAVYAMTSTTGGVKATISVDGVDQTPKAPAYVPGVAGEISASQIYAVVLSPAKHTIKLRGIKVSEGTGTISEFSGMLYELVAL